MAKMEFKRGDNITHTFSMPADAWSAGGTLFFAAKPVVDDDTTDASAAIDVSFDDTVVTDDGTNKKYTCAFVPTDTSSIDMGGSKEVKLLGEFQWVSSTGEVSTFPGNAQFLDVIVYADIKRETA